MSPVTLACLLADSVYAAAGQILRKLDVTGQVRFVDFVGA